MEIIIITVLVCIILLLIALLVWSRSTNRQLEERNHQIKVRNESNRRAFNHFIHKLATVSELSDAMAQVTAQICEDIDAESVGIFIPDFNQRQLHQEEREMRLGGVACTSYFPILTSSRPESEVSDMFGNMQERIAYFRTEKVIPGKGLLGNVYLDRKARVFSSKDIRETQYPIPKGIDTMMILPLTAEDRFVGLMCAVNRKYHVGAFDAQSLENFIQMSTTVSLTASLIMIYAERRTQDRLRQEIEFSVELQKSLLPTLPENLDSLRLAALSKPCHDVSGDFYDYLPLADGRVLILVADATGKGIPACMLTSMCRSFVRSLASRFVDLPTLMLELNRLVYENSDDAHYVTANLLLVDSAKNQFEYGCAGHTPLLLIDDHGTVNELKPSGPALGMWPNEFASFETVISEISPGERLCVFTDGINEALNKSGEEFGLERLSICCSESIHEESPADFAARIMERTVRFAGEARQSDDQTVFVIERRKQD